MGNLWGRWRAHRENLQLGKAFLALPHDKYDPECVMFDAQKPVGDWNARCPTCNAEPVHYLDPRGGAVHAFLDVTAPGLFEGDPSKVTCRICLSVIEPQAAQ